MQSCSSEMRGRIRIFHFKISIAKMYMHIDSSIEEYSTFFGFDSRIRGKELDWRAKAWRMIEGKRICLGISIRLGEKFVGKNPARCLRLFHRVADFLLETTDVETGGERLAIVRPEREVEEEGSRKRKPRSKQSGRYSRPTADGAKSRGLLIPISLFLWQRIFWIFWILSSIILIMYFIIFDSSLSRNFPENFSQGMDRKISDGRWNAKHDSTFPKYAISVRFGNSNVYKSTDFYSFSRCLIYFYYDFSKSSNERDKFSFI